MADEIGITEVALTIEQVISNIVQDELKQKGVLSPSVTDMSSQVKPGMDRVSFPIGTSLTAQDKVENTDLAKQSISFTNDVLQMDEHRGILVSLEDIAGLQAKPDVEREVIKRMASELILDFDEHIYSKLKLASAAAPDHRIAYANSGSANTLGKADILEARTLLNKQFVPQSERILLVSPDSEKNLLAIDDFVRVDSYGGAFSEGLMNGELGRLYGFKVLMSTIVADAETVAYHKSAVRFAYQQNIKYEQQRDIAALATKHAMSTIYGAKEMQGGKFSVLLGTAT